MSHSQLPVLKFRKNNKVKPTKKVERNLCQIYCICWISALAFTNVKKSWNSCNNEIWKSQRLVHYTLYSLKHFSSYTEQTKGLSIIMNETWSAADVFTSIWRFFSWIMVMILVLLEWNTVFYCAYCTSLKVFKKRTCKLICTTSRIKF